MREDLAIDYIKMACKKCKTKPVIKLPNSNVKLCRNDFIRYFEKKVVKTIGKYKLIEISDKYVLIQLVPDKKLPK